MLTKKKLFLLDLDGTLYLGDRLFDGTLDFLRRVREKGGRYLFTTNNSSRGVTEYVERLRGMGIDAVPEDFFTSTDVLIWYLRKDYAGALIYAVGTETFRQQLSQAGFRVTDRPEDGIRVVVCGFDTELTYQKVRDACMLLSRPEVDFLATNPDLTCPMPWGFIPDCGSICEMIGRAAGRGPRFVGKPEPEMVLLPMERWGYSKEETVMVGDRIDADIACGVRAGVDTAFVLSGGGVPADIERYGCQPTETYQDIREIFEKMG